MQAVRIGEFGAPDGLEVVEVPVPRPGAGQVLVRAEAIGVGGVDAVIRRGLLGTGFPVGMVPGSEVAGVVTATGEGVDPAWTGRRVWAFTGTGGAYAEQVLVAVGDVVALPDGLTAARAVTLGSAGPVAHFALAHAHHAPGESVLVRGAAGSIGIATVELAVQGGAGEVAVTTSSAERGRRLRELGATRVLDRSGGGGTDRYDVIIDVVGGPDVPAFLDRLAPNGRLVLVGAVAGFPPADVGSALTRAFQQSRSFATFSLDTVPHPRRDAVRADQFDAAVRGGLSTVVDDVLPLRAAVEAHRRMDAGTVFGRLVLVPGDGPATA
ncbi:zinc-binding dehydrogenase [Pseudonocardia sp. ICBG601]|uniref:zinc-binding dehydrogenase n=1 Tax=Pseudonocardia sp. ICBG601 TaxID=2846759 RepID=UPI001CF6CD81|nr:zinc-binding dehydrogenase [Pseudonocardia sp. ICBG601]